ncbi:MAG: DNA (cytosine-5-)-methyltransferase [Romboutsia timonensis]
MKVLSTFNGISCGRVALERAGIEVERYVSFEIDKYANQVAKNNYPNDEYYGDVFEADFKQYKGFDLLIGGSPCTYWSIAKQGRETTSDGIGFELFKQYVRSLEESGCKYFLYENNYSIHQNIKDEISKYLGVQPIMINSALVSAQNRKRCYWTNIPGVEQPEDRNVMISSILEDEVDDKYFIDTEKAIYICNAEAKKGKIAYIGKDSQGSRIYSIHGKSVTIAAQGGGWGAKTGLYWFPCITPGRLEKRQNGQRFKESNAKFYTLTTQDIHGILTKGRIRRLTPLECERLQTLPDNYTEGVSESQRYKCIGNGWTVNVISHILSYLK